MIDPYEELANAIIMQAVKDFQPAYKKLKRHPDDEEAQNTVREVTKFFCSDWFSVLTDLDGPQLLTRIMHEIDKEAEKFSKRRII